MTKTRRVPTPTYISVDIEGTSHSAETEKDSWSKVIREIGACVVGNPSEYCYIKFYEKDGSRGMDEKSGMEHFHEWVSKYKYPVFVSFNSWDWVHVSFYFWYYLGKNPFGLPGRSIDIKVYFMGKHGVPYPETHKHAVTKRYPSIHPHTHNGLEDAIEQAEIFEGMLWSSENGENSGVGWMKDLIARQPKD